MKNDSKNEDYQLCPGKEMMLKNVNELKEESFNRLIRRRARQILVEQREELENIKDVAEIEQGILTHEKVYKEPNFLPVSFLDEGAKCADAICRVVIRNNRYIAGYGTGFLVAPGIIMTNNHVLSDKEEAASSVIEFGFEEGETLMRVTLEPDRFFLTNENLDFTIVACDHDKVRNIKHIPLLRNPATVAINERVNIIQHPKGQKKQVVLHQNQVVRIMDKVIRYQADTHPGSSGSPVFNNNWELVALHHAGWSAGPNKTENEGIRISAIVAYLLNLHRRGSEKSNEFREVIHTIPDYSPYLGFFDLTGVEDINSNEGETPDFVGSRDYADIGFWNIDHFNNRVTQTRINNIADVISRLSMDVIGLTEVDENALNRLKNALLERGDNMNYQLLETNGRHDIAVMYDNDTCTVNLRNDIAEHHQDKLNQHTKDGKAAFPRWPLFVECNISDEGSLKPVKFIMVVVHLKAFGNAQSRARRKLSSELLTQIINDIRENENMPVVLSGDFNERLDNDVLRSLKNDTFDLFAMTANDATNSAISYIGHRHMSLIDHIIISNDIVPGNISGDNAAIVRLDRTIKNFSSEISDHVPVIFRMIMRKDPIPIDPVDFAETTFEIPSDAHYVNLQFN